MRKSFWNKELVMVFAGESGAIPLTKRWRIAPNIDGHIKDFPLKDVNQLPLRSRVLKMKPPQNPFPGPGEVVLDKMTIKAFFGVASKIPGFLKKASAIAKDIRLDQE